MPRTAKTYHQHITPEGRVLKCENPDNCPYKGAVHIEATVAQAKFMEQMIQEGKGLKAEKVQEQTEAAESKSNAHVIETNWHGDQVRAVQQENGRFTMKLDNGRILATDVGLHGGMSEEKAVHWWAENMAPFGAKKVEYPISSQTSNVQEITVYDHLSDSDVSVGYIFFQPGRGWSNVANMNELVAHAPAEKWGLLTAAAAAEDAYRSRVAYDAALEAGLEPTFTRKNKDGHHHNMVEYKQSDRSFGQRCTLCGMTSGRAITQDDGHEHVWEPYFSGSRCEKCGKKAGYDKLRQQQRQPTTLVDPVSEMSPAVKNVMLDFVNDRREQTQLSPQELSSLVKKEATADMIETELRTRGAKVLYEDAAARALGRIPQVEDRVYQARGALSMRAQSAFSLVTPNLKADVGDDVYLHEVRNADNEVESVTLKWGARSWSHEEITFGPEGKSAPYVQLQAWLNDPRGSIS
jgi:hypothetical protein